jgi:secreted Zn-dependent insulinase-like peptidase
LFHNLIEIFLVAALTVSECLPRFQIPYFVQDIEKSSMGLWEQTREAHEPLQLPCNHEFIPNNTCIPIGDIFDEAFSNMISPECIYDKELMKLWYKRNCSFKVPSSCVSLRLTYSKGVWDNAKLHVLPKGLRREKGAINEGTNEEKRNKGLRDSN